MPWSNDSEISAEENDWYGLDKVERWLRDGHAKKAPAVEICACSLAVQVASPVFRFPYIFLL
ncbi:hypothetical protein OF83DRAFT_1177911 [Amylostereum chailletii]|nr:hypothetical protein OF83DRAFT_1177911 [Amylostereum chailletii]